VVLAREVYTHVWNSCPGWYVVMGLEQQRQCRDSPVALLPRAAAPEGSLVVVAPSKARSLDMMGRGARIASTIQESLPTQHMLDLLELQCCRAFCPCCCSTRCPNRAGRPPAAAVGSSLAQPGLSQQMCSWDITSAVDFLLQTLQRWAGGASLSKLDGLCQG